MTPIILCKIFAAYITLVRCFSSVGLCMFLKLVHNMYVDNLPQTFHLCAISPVWVLVWSNRLCLRVNAFWHRLHLYLFSPTWVRLWSSRSSLCANALRHKLQLFDFTSVWFLVWALRLSLPAIALWHKLQWYSFYPEWVLTCRMMIPFFADILLQKLHLCVFSEYGVCIHFQIFNIYKQ